MTANDDTAPENEIRQAFNALSPYIPLFFEEEISLGLTDRFRYLRFIPSPGLQPNIQEGDPIPPGDAIYEALRLGKSVTRIISEDVYGIRFKAVGIPFKDRHGQVIGCIGIGRII